MAHESEGPAAFGPATAGRSIVHEINNLLLPIVTLAVLIEESVDDQQVKADAVTIHRCARMIAELLDSLAEAPDGSAKAPPHCRRD